MQIHQSIHLGYVCFSGQWLPIYKHRPWCGVGGLQNHYDFFDERRHHSMETAHRLWGCQGMRNPSLPTSIASRRYVCTCLYTAPQMYIQAVVMSINLLKSKTEFRISLWHFIHFSNCNGKEPRLESQKSWLRTPALPMTGYAPQTRQQVSLLEPQFPHLWNGTNRAQMIRSLWGWNERMHVIHLAQYLYLAHSN